MNPRAESVANEAIFHLQFNSRDAVRYIMRNAQVDEKTARTAVEKVVVFHKKVKSK